MDLNRRLPRVDTSRFSLVPKPEIPRSTFVTTHSHKSTFNVSDLVPILVDEVLPSDVHQGNVTIFCRLATPVFPIMDEFHVETFFFFVPARILWTNWRKMMGERLSPADSISYTVPVVSATAASASVGSVYDHMGIIGTVLNAPKSINALPLRAYNLIWNEWFRDQNLQNPTVVATGDGPDTNTDYVLLKRNKRPDYFTSALPWPLKGGTEVSAPLAGWAPVTGLAGTTTVNPTDGNPGGTYRETVGGTPTAPTQAAPSGWTGFQDASVVTSLVFRSSSTTQGLPAIFADLSTATGITINALRLAFQTQRLLERDARSGTRYTELLRAHFGVTPEDARLQRPEYIGGGRTSLQTQAIPQTSATGLTGGTSPLGALGASAVGTDQHSYTYHATEHGYIIGLANVNAQVTYQQGLHRLWTRSTRYDFYWPVFAHLGEQSIRVDEIYVKGDANDLVTFGYQERWAEYRHRPSRVAGLFRSTAAGNIDEWHLAEEFGSQPALNSTFLQPAAPMTRVLAAGAAANNMQILWDSVFRIRTTRAMPMFSVPGMIDRF